MSKRVFRSEDEKRDLIAKVEQAVKAGEATADACKALGIKSDKFYSWRSKFAGSKKKLTRAKRNGGASLVTLPALPMDPEVGGKITILIGASRDVQRALETLSQIRG